MSTIEDATVTSLKQTKSFNDDDADPIHAGGMSSHCEYRLVLLAFILRL